VLPIGEIPSASGAHHRAQRLSPHVVEAVPKRAREGRVEPLDEAQRSRPDRAVLVPDEARDRVAREPAAAVPKQVEGARPDPPGARRERGGGQRGRRSIAGPAQPPGSRLPRRGVGGIREALEGPADLRVEGAPRRRGKLRRRDREREEREEASRRAYARARRARPTILRALRPDRRKASGSVSRMSVAVSDSNPSRFAARSPANP